MVLESRYFTIESIEWFIEDKAFLRGSSSCVSPVKLTDGKGGGAGGYGMFEKQSNDREKAWHSIHNSFFTASPPKIPLLILSLWRMLGKTGSVDLPVTYITMAEKKYEHLRIKELLDYFSMPPPLRMGSTKTTFSLLFLDSLCSMFWIRKKEVQRRPALHFTLPRLSMVHPIMALNGLNQRKGSTKTTCPLFLFGSLWFTLYKSFEWSESEYSAPCIWEHTHV